MPKDLAFTEAVVVTPPDQTPVQARAVAMLIEEVAARSRVDWRTSGAIPAPGIPVVLAGVGESAAALLDAAGAPAAAMPREVRAEGFTLTSMVTERGNMAAVTGADDRGLLFGVGRLLRTLRLGRWEVALPDGLQIATAPAYPLRGHQLGYRPKTNSYDGWSLAMWEQYIRDLIVFGANAVELVPPRTDDAPDSPHFPLPPLKMMAGMSQLLAGYGLDVWIWFPAMDRDYGSEPAIRRSVAEWSEVFAALPRVDAVFVPGGDPGHTPPRLLFALLEQQSHALKSYHPNAGMWVSPQGFDAAWMEQFIGILRAEEPAWLAGVVFGPQVRVSLPDFRRMVPDRYPIRRYPDITHCRECQYPPQDWDLAYALTEGREGINPRPVDQAHIFRKLAGDAIGFISYSEGCNDDVNKVVWSALGWEPDADVRTILQDYSRYFIGPDYGEVFAEGLLALERNWRGSLAANTGVDVTLRQFQVMEKAATPFQKRNWRLQQALYRAYYDAYLRARLCFEEELETRATDALRGAAAVGALRAMEQAEEILALTAVSPPAQDLRARVFELAEALFQSICMQLSVPRYAAIHFERGANLDSIDAPVNNRDWLLYRFQAIRSLPDEEARRQELNSIVNWSSAGPGGFYDQPGDPRQRPHLVVGPGLEEDPGCYESVRTGFADYIPTHRVAWCRHAETLYDTPLVMRYSRLDPAARWRLRFVFATDDPGNAGADPRDAISVFAGTGALLGGPMQKPVPTAPVELAIPPEVIVDGELEVRWTPAAGRGRNGRGCQIAEVWLTPHWRHGDAPGAG
ncbi:MAG: hypothetical protein KGJ62_08150 [Armatimonadetes bacterium]|nr:hypothetical protein [Armatimonadota bacterium]MDE2205248.1 hypothetical protein [Armatimonadota bacterium]